MSYDVAVWTGPMPETDAAAGGWYQVLMEGMERDLAAARLPEPAPELVRFADELLQRYPDITSEAGEDSPWAVGPLKDNIVGSVFYFSVAFRRASDVLPFIAARAQAHGLVCFDPQTEKLLVSRPSSRRRFWQRRQNPLPP